MRIERMTVFVGENCETPLDADVERSEGGPGKVHCFECGGDGVSMRKVFPIRRPMSVRADRIQMRMRSILRSQLRNALGAQHVGLFVEPENSLCCLPEGP
jgi:hypothetical protein